MGVDSFRDLRVWQAGMDLVERIYAATQAFPQHEIYGLTSQMRRAAVSIPSNIAEGHTREHTKEYLHHLSIAQALLAQLQTQVEIAQRLEYISTLDSRGIVEEATTLAKHLYALRNAVSRRSNSNLPSPDLYAKRS
jgi:four helix bundle protein